MTSPLSSVSSTSTSTSAPAGTSASFVFEPIPEMFTCGLANVQWTYVGPSAPLTFNISNVNVAQQAPLSSSSVSSSSSTASPSSSTTVAILDTTKRQFNGYDGSYLPSINVIPTDAAGLDPTGGNWTWGGVNVPQGWYEMLAYVQGVLHTSSNSFFVANGTNTNCITQFAARSPSNQVPTSTASPSAIVATSSGHSHAGAIAGGVIGGVAFLAAVIIAFLYMCVRRRNGRPRRGGGRRWSELSFRKLRRGSDTPSSLRPAEPCLEADQTFVGSDEELSALGHEKVVAAAQPAILPQRAYTPSRRASTQTNRSYNRATPNSEAPIRRTSYNPPTNEAIQLERTNTSGGGPRRKPAPRYEGDEEAVAAERDGRTSSRTTLDAAHGNPHGNNGGPGSNHVLHHQSSFGAMRPMHVMTADPPAPTQS